MTGKTPRNDTETTDGEPRVYTRRDVLKTSATALAAGAVGTGAVGTVAATGDHAHLDVPEHVSISTDPADIEPWQPRLSWPQYPDQDPLAFYGMRVSSPDFHDDCIVGFHKYESQEGVSSQDSHDGDHEPIYVFFDADSGDVTNVVCSGYHWFRSSIPASSIRLVDTDAGQQPVLQVQDPWHHHLLISPEQNRDGRTFELRDLNASISAWLTNGMAGDLRTDQPFMPWRMRNADDWWREGTLNDIEILMKKMWVTVGIGDVPARDATGWDE